MGEDRGELEPGNYRMVILNNYDVEPFKGKKRMVMTTTAMFGGKFYFLAYSYMASAIIAFIGLVLVFVMRYMKSKIQFE